MAKDGLFRSGLLRTGSDQVVQTSDVDGLQYRAQPLAGEAGNKCRKSDD